MISIVDYGVGNIGSIANILSHVDAPCRFASNVEDLESATTLLLPGVGAFDAAMDCLDRRGFTDVLRRKVLQDRVPILGICLGMQLLARSSEEGSAQGLGFIDADFVKFRFPEGSPLKVPHMGWNSVAVKRENPLIDADGDEQRFYFVHSYFARCDNEADVIGTSCHGDEFVCAYGRDNVLGVQFHPEKSHKFGMRLLENFVRFSC